MLSKAVIYSSNALHEVTRKVSAKLRSRDGMELLQMVILIGIALALGGIIMIFLKDYFANDQDGFWAGFKTKLNAILNGGDAGGDGQQPPI